MSLAHDPAIKTKFLLSRYWLSNRHPHWALACVSCTCFSHYGQEGMISVGSLVTMPLKLYRVVLLPLPDLKHLRIKYRPPQPQHPPHPMLLSPQACNPSLNRHSKQLSQRCQCSLPVAPAQASRLKLQHNLQLLPAQPTLNSTLHLLSLLCLLGLRQPPGCPAPACLPMHPSSPLAASTLMQCHCPVPSPWRNQTKALSLSLVQPQKLLRLLQSLLRQPHSCC